MTPATSTFGEDNSLYLQTPKNGLASTLDCFSTAESKHPLDHDHVHETAALRALRISPTRLMKAR